MKNKTPLILVEQLVMLLVFSLASALCIRAFALAERTSQWNADRDRAVFSAQNAAEVLKAAGLRSGSMEGPMAEAARLLNGEAGQDLLYVYYDDNWDVSGKETASYHLCAHSIPSSVQGLCTAEIRIDSLKGSSGPDRSPLFQLTVAWQEVDLHG